MRSVGADRSAVWIMLAALVVATIGCGGSTSSQPHQRRDLPTEVLQRRAIAYSGYRAGQSPDRQIYPSEEEIKADLDLLVRGGWTLLRLFDSGPHAERVLRVQI